jgi:Na+/H+ antiporter NhaA
MEIDNGFIFGYILALIAFTGLNVLIMNMMKMSHDYIVISSICVFLLSFMIGGIFAVVLSVIIALIVQSKQKTKEEQNKEVHHYYHNKDIDKKE